MQPELDGGSDMGGSAASDTPASTESSIENSNENSNEQPAPAGDGKPQDEAGPANTAPQQAPLPAPLKPPMPQKDALKFLMKQLIAEMQKGLNRIKKRKKGQNADEEETPDEPVVDGPGQEMKITQEMVDSFRKMADDYLKDGGLVSKFLGDKLTSQLRDLADHCLKQMQEHVDRENANNNKNQPANNEPEPKQEASPQETQKTSQQETQEENENGEPLEAKMTEAEIVDLGREVGGMLKDDDFQQQAGVNSPEESKQFDELGGDADSMKASSSVELTLFKD